MHSSHENEVESEKNYNTWTYLFIKICGAAMKTSNESCVLIRPNWLQKRVSQIRHMQVRALAKAVNKL